MKALLAPNEAGRLEALKQYSVLDTPAETAFDELTRVAAHICQTPIALVVLVDETRLWFKSKIGMAATETPRDSAFCAHTILNGSEGIEVRDAALDSRFFDNPLVTSDPYIRFYAGVPLVTPGGHAVGSLCVIDRKPQALTAEQFSALRTLGRQAIAQLELRRHAGELARQVAENERMGVLLQQRFQELEASKQETDRLLALGEKSRRALLSVLEDEKLNGKNLRASEASLASAQQRAKIGSWELTLADRKGIWSAEMFRLFARDPALGILNRDQFMAMVHPHDRELISRNIAQVIAQRCDFLQEFRVVWPDGNVYWIESRGKLTYSAAGQPVSLIGTSQDISERKRAEALLLDDNQILQMIASGAQLCEVLAAIVTSVESANRSALCSILLLDKDGVHLRQGAGPSLPPDYNTVVDGLAIGENVGSCGTAAYRKETIIVSDIASDARWLGYQELALKYGLKACWSTPIKDANDHVLGTFAIYYRECRLPDPFDFKLIESATNQAKIVIERKRAEAALRDSEARWQFALESAGDGVWDWDVPTSTVFYSKRFKEALGYTEAEIGTGLQEWSGRVHPEDMPGVMAKLQPHLDGMTAAYVNEHRVRCKDGGYKWILDRGLVIARDSAGRPQRMVGTHSDITQRKQMEEQLRQTASTLEQRVTERTHELQAAQLSKTRFFAAASHDLLQPLNAARIFASSLAQQRELSDASLHIVQRIDSALLGAEEVIDVLVDVAKLDTGAVHAVIEDVDLHEILAGLAEQFSAIAERRNLQLRVGPCQVIIRSDRRLLRRVLQNLISNALRYTARGGVLIGVRRRHGRQIRIDVVDTGPGIPAEAISQIFEEFRRGGQNSPWGEKGLGLGLAICMRICKLLGHKLNVNSVPGHGSTFSLKLDSFRVSTGVVSPAPPAVRAQFGLSLLRVLCVDDNIEVLDAMISLLRSWNITCERAGARLSALEAARLSRPDVVIVDYQFDETLTCNGLQIINALRELYPERPPAAIMITANRSAELQVLAKQLGIPMLHKPLRAARLRSLLESVSRGYDSITLQSTDDFIS